MSEVIDHVRTSFAFNLENVKVVIHVALLICLNYSHILFSYRRNVYLAEPWPKMGQGLGSRFDPYITEIFLLFRVIERLMSYPRPYRIQPHPAKHYSYIYATKPEM